MEELEIVEVPLETVLLIRQKVMYPNIPLSQQKVESDLESQHLGVKLNNEIVAVISLYEHDGRLQFRKFATLQELQGKGIGSYLMKYVFELAEKKRYKSIWCNARLNASGFYQKFQMMPFGEKWFDKGFEFVKMKYDFE